MGEAMQAGFRSEVEKSGNETKVTCHGRLVAETAKQLKEVVKPLVPLGGRIQVDLTDVNYVDSSGLGTLVGLKASALHEGYCTLEFINLSARLTELLRITKLTELFASKPES